MRALAIGVLVVLACPGALLGQERDRSLERIGFALQQPLPVLRASDGIEPAAPKRFGIFTLVPPAGPGEIVRISVPIGELVSRAFKSVAAAHRRREEAVARRRVEAALERFKAQSAPPRQ